MHCLIILFKMLFRCLHCSLAELVYLVLSFLFQIFADSSSYLQVRQVGICLSGNRLWVKWLLITML
jgi:hypothetical protein